MKKILFFLLLLPSLLYGQSFTSKGNEIIYVKPNTVFSSVGGVALSGTATNTFSLPQGTALNAVSPASERVLVTNPTAKYQVRDVETNQTANFYLDLMYSSAKVAADVSIVNKSALATYDVSLEQKNYIAFTAIPVQWTISRLAATTADVSDLSFTWGNALEPVEIANKRLFIFNATLGVWDLLPEANTTVNETTNTLTYTGFTGKLEGAKFMIAEASKNANLYSLTISSGTLTPAFDPANLIYDVVVPVSTTNYSFTPTLSVGEATLKVNGTTVTSAALYSTTLTGNTTTFTISVTSMDGSVTKNYILRVLKSFTALPTPTNPWVNLFTGARFDPNDDQQATSDTDILGNATDAMAQAQQSLVSINGTIEKVYYFRVRLANAIKNNGTSPSTSFYYGLDVNKDQKIDLVVEANAKASIPYVAYHVQDPSKDGSGPSKTAWLNSTTNLNIERKLTATNSEIRYYATTVETNNTTNLDIDAPISGSNTGNDTWLEFAFTEASFKSFTKDALGTEKSGSEVAGLVAFTSTSQTANGDIGGINDKTANLNLSWAELGVILTSSFEDVTIEPVADPMTVDVISTKSLNGDARIFGVWNGEDYPNSILTVNVYEPAPNDATLKETFIYNNATATSTGLIATTGYSWYIDVTGYAAGLYPVKAVMSDASARPNIANGEGTLLITSVKINDLVTDDTTPTITGISDRPAGTVVTITLYKADGTLVGTFTTTTLADGSWSFTIPNPITVGTYDLNAEITVGTSKSADEIVLKIVNSPSIDITSNLAQTYGSTTLSGVSNQTAVRTVDLVLTNSLGEELTYTIQTDASGNWSFDLKTLPAGDYQVYVSIVDANGIRGGDQGILTVNKKPLIITAVNKTKIFGEVDPTLTVTYNSFVNNESIAALTGNLVLSRVTGETVGDYVISASGFTSTNYDISYVTGKLSITNKSIASTDITVAALPDVVYNGLAYEPLPKVYDRGSLLSLGMQYTITSYTSNLNVGEASITIAGTGNFDGTRVVKFNITKAPLTIKALDKTKVYGTQDPTLTVTYTGFVNGESEISTSLNITPTISRATGENVANYTITPSNVSLSNYNVSYETAKLSITGKSIASNDISISGVSNLTYNGLAQTQSIVLTDTSFDPDKILVLGTDYSLSYSNNTNVGTATITITGLGNYSGINTATFAINKASLTVTAENKSKTYGDADPALTLTYAGFVNSESASVLGGTLSLSRAVGETINTYAITASGYSSSNYTISYVPGVFTINAKLLSSQDIGISPRPDVVYNGSSQSLKPNVYDLGALLTEGTNYTLSFSSNTTDVGTVTVTVTGVGAYSGTKTTTYAITHAPLTIKANDQSKVFGSADPSLTVIYAGFVGTETIANLTGNLTVSRTTTENVGIHSNSITATGFTSSNYNITYLPGTFTITARAITSSGITIDPVSAVTFNGTAHTPSVVIKDGTTTLASPANYTLSYSNNTNAGTATITITGVGNYSGTRTINFTIDKAPLTITAVAKTKTFGSSDPTFTATISGLVRAVVNYPSDLNGSLGFTRVSGEAVGTYSITPNGYTSGNYTISYIPADLSITAKDISTATDISIEPIADVVYKGADYLVLPIVKDGNILLVKDTDYTLTYSNNKDAGTATLTVTGAGNYTGVKSLNFTISKAALTITADNKNKLTGQADPTFTVTYTGFAAAETASVLSGTLSFTRATGETKGDYDITPKGYNTTQTNYTLTYVKGTLTISGTDIAGASITVDPIADLTYDGTAQIPPLVIMDTSLDPDKLLDLEIDYTLSYSNNIDAGTASVLITGKGSYFGTRIITFKILPKTLTVTADDKTKVYGEKDPVFSYAISGYITGESLTVTGALFRAVGETVANSPYAINLGNLAISDKTVGATTYKASNYKLDLVTGKILSITKAPLTVIVNDDAKFVGQPDVSTYAGVSYTGFVFGEDETSAGITGLTITRSNFTNNAAGVYPGVLSAANASAANYSFTYSTTANYTIVRADQLLIQLGNASTVFGTTPTYTVVSAKYAKLTSTSPDVYTITDLTNSTFITGSTVKVNEVINSVSTETASFTISPKSPVNSTSGNLKVGTYVIIPGAIIESSANFNNTIVLTGTLAVTQKALTAVVSGGTSKVYDGKFPMDVLNLGFDLTYSPFTDDVVTANGIGIYTTKDVGSSNYTVSNLSLTGDDAANYYISGGASATILGTGGTITARPLTVTPIPNQSKTYGATDPTLLYTYLNNVDGETPVFTGALSRATGETKGDYNILLGNLALADNSPFLASNYSLNFTPNVKFNIINNNLSTSGFSVNAIPSVVYNGLDQTPSVVVNDLSTNPITQLSASTDYTLSYTNNKNVGTATVTITGNGNYFGSTTATFQITKAPLSVTAVDKSKGFGELDPTLTVNYVGFVASENASNVTATTALAISRQAGENIGSYIITSSALAYSNYEVSFVKGLLTIGAKDLSTSADFEVSAISDQVYKGFAQTPSLTITDKSFDPDKTLVLGSDYTLTYADNINVGQATVTILAKGNYSGSRTANFNITKASLSIIADDKTITFGEPIPTLTATYTGFVNGETSDALPGRVLFPTITASTQGVYPIKLAYVEPRSVISSGNYQLTFTDGDLTVGTKDISSADVTVSSLSDIIYTGAAHSLEPIVKDGATTLTKDTDYTLSYSTDKTNVGTVTVTITGAGNYSGSRTITFNITKASLTITAENKTKVFGDLDPSFTATYIGFVTNESAASLSVTPTFTRASGSAVNIYDITPSGVSLNNYNIIYVKGTLSITAKSLSASGLTVTAPADVAYTGLAHNLLPVIKDGSTTLTKDTDYTLSYSPNVNVGTVTISITGKGNYSGTITSTFAITPVSLTITAQDKSKVYGSADPSFTVSYSGFVNSENEAKLGGLLAFSRVSGETPADYLITPSGLTSSNYTIGFVTGKLTISAKALSTSDITVAPIADVTYTGSAFTPSPLVKDLANTLVKDTDYTLTYISNTDAGTASLTLTGIGNYSGSKTVDFIIKKAALTITAEDNAKVYRSSDPALTVRYDGFVGGESETSTPAVFTGTLTVSRTAGENFGIYPITASGFTAANYQITYVPGVFSISSKLISSTDVSLSGVVNKVYTGVPQTQSGLLLKDGANVLVNGTHYSLIYTNNTYVGTSTISISGIGDYSGTRSITFQISKAPLSITALPKSKTFGESDPPLTVSYSTPGFVNNETVAVLGGKLDVTRAEGETATTYLITPSGYTSTNYDIVFVNGVFTINKKDIAATDISVASIPAVTYRGTDYTPEPIITDAAGNKTLIKGTDYTLAYSNNLNAGTADILVTGIGNYSGSRIVQFVINKASLVIKADDKERAFEPTSPIDPTLTVTYTGFVNGENETSASLNFTPTIARAIGEAVATYTITPSNVTLSNYDVSYQTGIFTISTKSITNSHINVNDIADLVYTGLAHSPDLFIYDQNIQLVKGTDFTVAYSENINAGTATITITGINNYSGTRTKTFVIKKAPLSITALGKSKIFGEADPVFDVTYLGFVNNEDEDDLLRKPSVTREVGDAAATYVITPSGALTNNYVITYHTANLIISTKSISDINSTDIFIGVISSLTYSGLPQTPVPNIIDLGRGLVYERDFTLTFVNNLNVGKAGIGIMGIGNYTGSRTIDFDIVKARLEVKADNKIKIFGTVDPDLTASYNGFVNNETIADLSGSLLISRDLGESIGTYSISVGGWSSSNYDIAFQVGTLTIGNKDIAGADITTSIIDDVIYTGLAHTPEPILKDGNTVLQKNIDYKLSYSPNVDAGTVTITIDGITNYSGSRTIDFDIQKAELSINAKDNEKIFGEADPSLEVDYVGFVNEESQAVLLGTLINTRANGEAAGTYDITPAGFTSNNYAITFNTGTFTIKTKDLSSADISVESIAEMIYKGTPYTPEPLMKDGAIGMVLNTDYTLSYTNNLNVGKANILITGIGNYSGTLATSFEIIKKLLTISINNNSKLIGSADPTLTVSYSGFVANESPADLGGTLLITREQGEAMGTYTVSVEGYTSSNYDIVFKSGTFVIGDSVKPTIITKDITIELDEKGQASIQVSDIDNGTYDAGGISSRTLSLTSFDCASVGVNTVVFTVTDNNFNVSTANVTVTVINNAPDTDGDGLKNNCDNDDDNDGVSDVQELIDGTNSLDLCSFKLSSQNLTPSAAWKNADCDGDGVSNGQELSDGTDPLNGCVYKVANQVVSNVSVAWSNQDCDSDGLTNGEELTGIDNPSTLANPKGVKTSPLSKDSDGDGASDGDEAIDGTNPNDSCSFKLTSQKLSPSTAWNNADCDGDGVINGMEKADGTSSLSNCDLKVASRTLQPNAAWKNGDCDNDGLTNEVDGIEDCDKDGKENFIDFDACRIDILMATVFTPNGDGINDEVKPVLLGIEKFVCFKVFNRWGNLIFETKDREKGWNGNLGTTEQATETFQWLSEGYDRDGNLVKRTGMVTLIR